MSVKKVNKTTGSTTKVAGLVNSEKVNTMYGAFPSDASASNKLVSDATADEKISDAIADKADKVSSATNGNFAGLDASGNLTDSGKKAGDFATAEGLADEAKTRGVLGAKNLAPITLDSIKTALNSNNYHLDGNNQCEVNDIVLTVTLDSNGNVAKCNVNGTASATTFFRLWITNKLDFFGNADMNTSHAKEANGYIISGSDNANATFCYSHNINDSYSGVYIRVQSGATVDVDVYPMIRLATDTDTTYRPYVPTNSQLLSYKDNGVLGAKNFLPNTGTTEVINGVTFTFNEDKTITVTSSSAAIGTCQKYWDFVATEDIPNAVLTGCPSGGTSSTYWLTLSDRTITKNYIDYGDGKNCALVKGHNYRVVIVIYNNYNPSNKVFKPMIRLASDTDNTYQPYAETNYQLTQNKMSYADNSILGAKNLLPYPYNQTTKTVNGVTFTDNGDGSITLNGTNTGNNTFFMFNSHISNSAEFFSKLKKMNTSFKLLGGVNSPLVVFEIDFYDSSNTYIGGVTNTNNTPTVFTIPSNAESIDVFIRCGTNATYSNFTCYPMLYLASITDDTYEPYAKTNQELTEAVQPISVMLNDLGAKNIFNFLNFEAYNATVSVNGDALHIVTENKISANAYYTLNNLKKNTDYVLSMKIDYTSGVSGIYIGGSATESNFTEIVDNSYTEDTEVSFRFNTGSYNYIRISLFATRTTAMDGDTTFSKLMLRDASIVDDTYEPYAKTNQQLTQDTTGLLDNKNTLGAKNLLPLSVSKIKSLNTSGTWTENSYTSDGITVVINTDTQGDVEGITLNGTATSRFTLYLDKGLDISRYNSMIINGNSVTSDIAILRVEQNLSPWTGYSQSNNNDKVIGNYAAGTIGDFLIRIFENQTVSNLVIKPMVRLATDSDSTFVPYAKSNRELTDALAGFELATYEGTAPADTTDYKIESVRTVLGFKPSYFTILAAERYNTTNSVWYQMSNDMTATDYVIKAASDSNGVDYRVKFSDVTNYTKYRVVILYKR